MSAYSSAIAANWYAKQAGTTYVRVGGAGLPSIVVSDPNYAPAEILRAPCDECGGIAFEVSRVIETVDERLRRTIVTPDLGARRVLLLRRGERCDVLVHECKQCGAEYTLHVGEM